MSRFGPMVHALGYLERQLASIGVEYRRGSLTGRGGAS